MKEPENTCPIIDKAIGYIRKTRVDLLIDAEDELERIRKANEELREWGKHWYDKAQDFESETLGLWSKNTKLESELDDVKDQLATALAEAEFQRTINCERLDRIDELEKALSEVSFV